MSVKRTAVAAAIAAGVFSAACAAGAPPSLSAPEPVRATPPPTAYVGMLAATSAPSTTPDLAVLEQARGWSGAATDTAAVELSLARPVAPPATSVAVAAGQAPRTAGARARVVDRAATSEKRVALTFDAGADRGYAEQILDTLRDQGVHASFGMTGQWAEANPDLLRRMVAEGHLLINHTQTHDSFTGLSTGRGPKSSEARTRELAMTEQAVQRIGGVSTKPYFRPPYGDTDASVSEDVYAQGYEVVAMWTVDSQGWNGLSRSGIEARCLRAAAPGAIYVFHVGSAAQDGPALPAVIEGLKRQGYQMGTLDWLLHP